MRELDHRNTPDCKVSPLADIYDYCRYYTKIPPSQRILSLYQGSPSEENSVFHYGHF